MSKFWTILKYEYAQVVKKKSFLFGLLLTPALMAAFILIPSYFARTKSTTAETIGVIDAGGQGVGEKFVQVLKGMKIEGTQDPAYNVAPFVTLPEGDLAGLTRLEDSLKTAINNKELKYVLVVKPHAELSDSNLYLVTNSSNFTTISRFERELSQILSSQRLEMSSVNLSVDSVLSLTRRLDLRTKDTKGESMPFEVKYLGAIILVMLMYGMIVTYGMLVMRSVIEEKNSRIMEVMVSSVSPFQLMMGKIMGLGAATFTAVSVWVVLGAALYFGSGAAGLPIDPSIARLVFNPVVVVFFVLFLISGYIMYSTIFALVGSLVNTEKEAQNFLLPITMSALLPVFVGIRVVQEPYSPMAMILSFIPIFSPTMMMMRVTFIAPTATHYSLFSGILAEATLAFILVVLTTLGIVWLTAKIFRVGILMYGKRPTLPEIIKWVKY